jgi:hypothetical protein
VTVVICRGGPRRLGRRVGIWTRVQCAIRI